MSDDLGARHDELFRRGCSILDRIRKGAPRPSPSAKETAAAETGCALLDQVLVINPHNWAACFIQGMAWRNVQRWDCAYAAFSRAYAINPDHREVAREFSIACAQTAHYDEAVDVARGAMANEPNDPGLLANYALFLHQAGRNVEARAEIARAVELDPRDPVTLLAYRQISAWPAR